MDIREELKRWIAVVLKDAEQADSKVIKKDAKLFLDTAHSLIDLLANRNETLRRQCRPRKASAPSPAPVKPQKQPAKPDRSDDTPNPETGAKDRAQELSGVQQGIQQALRQRSVPMTDKRALRQQTYGGMDDDKRLRVAAQGLTR